MNIILTVRNSPTLNKVYPIALNKNKKKRRKLREDRSLRILLLRLGSKYRLQRNIDNNYIGRLDSFSEFNFRKF